MKYITLLLVAVLLFSCRDKKDKNPPLPQTLRPIPENGILAQWANPHIVVYQFTDSDKDRYTTRMRFFGDNGFAFDTVLFEDGTVIIDSLSIDTITLSNGTHPEIIFTWYSSGKQVYENDLGGSDLDLKSMAIWDINKLQNIFYTDTYVHELTKERLHPDDPLTDTEKDFITDESTEAAIVSIDTLQKIIKLEFQHSYHDSTAWSQEIYRYKNGTFVSDDGAEPDEDRQLLP